MVVVRGTTHPPYIALEPALLQQFSLALCGEVFISARPPGCMGLGGSVMFGMFALLRLALGFGVFRGGFGLEGFSGFCHEHGRFEGFRARLPAPLAVLVRHGLRVYGLAARSTRKWHHFCERHYCVCTCAAAVMA
jgi:hypothetical protein